MALIPYITPSLPLYLPTRGIKGGDVLYGIGPAQSPSRRAPKGGHYGVIWALPFGRVARARAISYTLLIRGTADQGHRGVSRGGQQGSSAAPSRPSGVAGRAMGGPIG